MHSAHIRFWPTLAVLLLASGSVLAAPPTYDAPPSTPILWDATDAETCQWSPAVNYYSDINGCSGTLIHPRVVVTAAHCVVGSTTHEIRIGEDANTPVEILTVESCTANPVWEGPLSGPGDIAFCVLAEPLDLPYAPPAYGCERDLIQIGTELTQASYGHPDYGIKRWRTIHIDMLNEDLLGLGATEASLCPGDSGGAALLQVSDSSYRAVGVGGGTWGDCGEASIAIYVSIPHWVPWIEETSGIDVTPCHDVDGTWNPGPACEGFMNAPFASGTWEDGCSALPRSSAGHTCEANDVAAPTVTIVDPLDESYHPEPMATIDFVIEAVDMVGLVDSVSLYIDGNLIATDDIAPWLFEGAEFPAGTWHASASATDFAGNVGMSEPITFHVGQDAPSGESEGESSGDTSDEAQSSESGADEVGNDASASDGSDARGCRSTGMPGASALALLGLLALLRRRPRAQGRRDREGQRPTKSR